MPQQTAIEKLIESLEYWNISIDCENLFQQICIQALEIEKKQIEQAYLVGFNVGFTQKTCGYIEYKDGTEYYNKTFKQ
jgi:hypothetical protein